MKLDGYQTSVDSTLALTKIPQDTSRSAKEISSSSKQFESILLGQWLQGAETSFSTVPGADGEEDSGDEQMRSFATQSLAKAFSDAGGIGLADMVSRSLTRASQEPHQTSSPTEADREMRAR